MIATTPLEQALQAWSRNTAHLDETQRRQVQFDDAVALGETHAFSNRNIALIVGLDVGTVCALTGKKDKTGGRLNPEALPFIHDLYLHYARYGRCNRAMVTQIVALGTSFRVISALTGVPVSTVAYKPKEKKA